MMQSLLDRMHDAAVLCEDTMRRYFASKDTKKTTLYRAMEYGVMGGGKRIRPFLTLEFCRCSAAAMRRLCRTRRRLK